MLTSAPGEHWRPAESLSQQSCCSWLVQCVQGMSSGRGHRGALRSGLGLCAAQAAQHCPERGLPAQRDRGVLGKGGESLVCPRVSRTKLVFPQRHSVMCCHGGAQALLPARISTCTWGVLVTAGTRQELFCREGQQVLRHNNNQIRPALVMTRRAFLAQAGFSQSCFFVLKLVDRF